MPKFIPPSIGKEVKSPAEKKIFEALSDLKLNNCYVLHSLGLPRHNTKVYGEVDFVVVCTRGVACLEIKGGRIACRDGMWIFTDRYGIEHEKPEGPYAQVTGNMFSLRNEILKRFDKNPHINRAAVVCGVMFPDIHFKSVTSEAIEEITYDAGTEDITKYITGIFDYWQNKRNSMTCQLSAADVKMLVDYLRGDFCFEPLLADRINEIDDQIIRLTREQTILMDALSGNKHLLVEGGAGTGKTILATDFAIKRAGEGERVLFLTFNKNLSHDVSKHLSDYESVKVINIHALFGEYVDIDIEKVKSMPKDYFYNELPEEFLDYISSLSEEDAEDFKYDTLIIDEGQDIIRPVYIYIFEYLLKGGMESGRWIIFYDELQNIYNPDYTEGMELMESFYHTSFKLTINCRNTLQIGEFCEKASGVGIRSYIREEGEEVRIINFDDEKGFSKNVEKLYNSLIKERIAPSDIVFLSHKRYSNSMLCNADINVYDLASDNMPDDRLPVFSTIQGFKGLDSKVVILVDVESIHEDNLKSLMYIASTRARTLLYLLMSDDCNILK